MMKNTLEQLEKSHKEIVAERDHLCANLKRELRDIKTQITVKQDSRALEVEMQVGSPAEAQVLQGARARSMLEEENAALRLALVQAQEDLTVVEEVAQLATQNQMNTEIEALVEGLRRCEEAMEAMRKRELESSALHQQRAREHLVLQAARDKDLATIQLFEAEVLHLRLALHQNPSSSAKNGVAFSLPLLLGAQTSSAYTPRSWLTEATPRSADAWTSGSEGGSPASSPNQGRSAWAGPHSLHMQQPDASQETQREFLLGMAVLQQNEDFQAAPERVTQLSAKLSALEEELAHERGLRETANLLLLRQQQFGNFDDAGVSTSLSLLASPNGPKRSAQNLTLSRSGSPASPLPEQSRQALLHLHTQRVRQLKLELDGKVVTSVPESSANDQDADAGAVIHRVQGLRLEIHQLEQEKERLEREKAKAETAHAEIAAALADAALRIAELEKQLQLQHKTAKSKIEALEMCASSSTTAAVSMSVQLAESMVRGLGIEKQLQLQYETAKQKTEALEMCVSSSTTAVTSVSVQLAELQAREAAAAGATATAEARDVAATRGVQLVEAVSTIESLSRKIQASEAACESAKQRAVERERELDEAHLLIKSLNDRLREREGERESWDHREGQREILPGQESEANRDTPGTQRDARVGGEEDNTLEEEEWGTPAFVLPEMGDRHGEEKLQMLKEISALRNRESVLRVRLQEAETSLLQSAKKAARESNPDCEEAHNSDFTLTRTPKALHFPASPEAPLSLSSAGADINEGELDRESLLRVKKRELETLLQGEHEDCNTLLSFDMFSSMTHLAESAEMLLLRCQERLRTKMAAWDREEQEREEERIVWMRERDEWCRQSQAYVRRIAEMEKEGEECVEHLEGEIDRLLNKVEETTSTPLRISRMTSAIRTPAHVLSPILQLENTPQEIPQRLPAAALSFSSASPALLKCNQVLAFSDIAEEDSIVTSTDMSSPMMIHPSSPRANAGFVDEEGPAPNAAAHRVLLKGSYASHASAGPPERPWRPHDVNATASVPSNVCTIAPQIAERRSQDEMEQVRAREKVRIQEMRELEDKYNVLQLRHTALLQTQEPASVAIAVGESLAEAQEALQLTAEDESARNPHCIPDLHLVMPNDGTDSSLDMHEGEERD